jgi:hypothetical protein
MPITEKDLNDPLIRKALAEKSDLYFTMIYFPHLFKSLIPEFHKRWYKLFDFRRLDTGERFTYLILMAFRESAKTSLAKIKIVKNICLKRKKLISYVCYEKEASKAALFDIATWLQTNQLLVEDYGNLFYSKDLESKQSQQKTISNFVTANGVRVMAKSIRQSTRGTIFDVDRPDCYVLDDFENNVTKKSAVITRKVIDFFKELMTGLSANAEVIIPCNKISDTGSVQWLLDTALNNPEFVVEDVPVIIDGKSVWPSKFALTDEEAKEFNSKVEDPKKWCVSLESKKRTMNADGKKTFEQEMLNQPLVEGDRFFDMKKIDARLAVLRAKEYQSDDIKKPNYYYQDGDWKRWYETEKFENKDEEGLMNFRNSNGDHIVVAADVSQGYGKDSSVIQVLNCTKGKQIAEYESNRCPIDLLSTLMMEEGKKAGNCLLCPERNSIGVGVIENLKNNSYLNMYREKTIDSITEKPVHKFGFHTNGKTKSPMLFEFKRDFEKGLIEINSMPLLREMRSFTNTDVSYKNFDPEASNHFDRVMAFAIAWRMRDQRQAMGFLTS